MLKIVSVTLAKMFDISEMLLKKSRRNKFCSMHDNMSLMVTINLALREQMCQKIGSERVLKTQVQ